MMLKIKINTFGIFMFIKMNKQSFWNIILKYANCLKQIKF